MQTYFRGARSSGSAMGEGWGNMEHSMGARYTIAERLNLLADATAEWAGVTRAPSSAPVVVAMMGARSVLPMWDDVALVAIYQRGRGLAATRYWANKQRRRGGCCL